MPHLQICIRGLHCGPLSIIANPSEAGEGAAAPHPHQVRIIPMQQVGVEGEIERAVEMVVKC